MGWGSVSRGSELPDLGVCKTPSTMEGQGHKGTGDLAGTRPVTGVKTELAGERCAGELAALVTRNSLKVWSPWGPLPTAC